MNPSHDTRSDVDQVDEQRDRSHHTTHSTSAIAEARRDGKPTPAERPNVTPDKPVVRNPRGFAGMDPVRQREIAALGGRAAHQQGTAHKFDSEEARVAGRKGGQASGVSRNAGENSKSEPKP